MLVVAACTIKLRGDSSDPAGGSMASGIANPLGAELERCRNVTPEQVAELQACRLIWAENRHHFLGSKKTAQMKDAGPRPLGWPPIAAPERE
jgi:conjugative transfer region protein TrbK